jgi:predicted O-methyltransferase YrrM
MEHFYKDIQGWADGIDLLYGQIIQRFPTPGLIFNGSAFVQDDRRFHFVEIGSWRGKSSAFMAVEIANSGKNIQFDCVDTWRGSVDEAIHQEDAGVVNDTLYQEFLDNMKPVEAHFRPVRMTSLEAATTYLDNSLDFVFIYAQHDYDSVKADILAWAPKVKRGGILAGHDYNYEGDHGVGKAVRELFTEFQTPPWCWAKQM